VDIVIFKRICYMKIAYPLNVFVNFIYEYDLEI